MLKTSKQTFEEILKISEKHESNAGLKDIRAALRWINENIGEFGGDVDNVTVFGQGTGGTAAIMLTMTETTKGLFHRIISQSGSVLTPQSFDPNPLKTAIEFAKTLELNSEDPDELFELFDTTPLIKIEEELMKQMNAKSVFLPSVEKEFDDEEAFLTDTPFNILKEGLKNPVPIIIGLNTVEGLTKTLDFFTITSEMDRILHDDISVLNCKSLTPSEDDKEEYYKTIKDTYFSNATTEESVIGGLINYHSDFSFIGPISLMADMYANTTKLPVYQYIFNYIGNRNIGKILTNSSLPATTNRDEVYYIFELERFPLPIEEEDARMITFMTQMWTNFAKTGSPTPDSSNGEWLPHPHHLAIALEPQYVTTLTPERAYFWRTMFFKCANLSN
ncbi:hypothetical protein K1T71_014749 [Dendrolimus kikuchii]|nr:hypothetical protein K1T71_014749 [Dendrolimus kikuchii]